MVHKDVYQTGGKEYASKGVAGAGLGLGIAGTALGLLAMNKTGLFGNSYNSDCAPSSFQAWRKACDSEMENQKTIYDLSLINATQRFNDRRTIDTEMFSLYKGQIDADFRLYKGQRDQFDELANRISKLETATAVNAAIEPWRSKVLQMEIGNVANLVTLEAERRMCADNKIVNYTNSTFYPVQIAQVALGTDVAAKGLYNPLCDCHGYPSSPITVNK